MRKVGKEEGMGEKGWERRRDGRERLGMKEGWVRMVGKEEWMGEKGWERRRDR